MVIDRNSIDHLVILTMENRSFDHFLGSLSMEGRLDVNGLPNPLPSMPDKSGNMEFCWNMDGLYSGYGDPPHTYAVQHACYNMGKMDGFVKEYHKTFPLGKLHKSPSRIPLGYYTRETLPVIYSLCDHFAVCDHWFSSLLSSTWPNRKYLFSSMRDDDTDSLDIPAPPGFKTRPLFDSLEKWPNVTSGSLCTWKNYFSDMPFIAFWYDFALEHAHSHFLPITQFIEDCHNQTLPTVSIVDPPFSLADDHPSFDVRRGQKFIKLIVDALTLSDSWHNTALVLLYDENGGFYDHVVPPQAFEMAHGKIPQDTPLGFRVPAVVISPYALRGKASNTIFDHTAVMKSIHTRWGVPFDADGYGTRFQYAPDIWESCFDFSQDPLEKGIYTESGIRGDETACPPAQSDEWFTHPFEKITGSLGGVEELLRDVFKLTGLRHLDCRHNLRNSLQGAESVVEGHRQSCREAFQGK